MSKDRLNRSGHFTTTVRLRNGEHDKRQMWPEPESRSILTRTDPAVAAHFAFSRFVQLWVILFFSGLICGISGFAFSSIGNLSQLLIPPITAVPML